MMRTQAFRFGGLATLLALGLVPLVAGGAQESDTPMAEPAVAPAPTGPYAGETPRAPTAPAADTELAAPVHPAYGERAPVGDYSYPDTARELSREEFMRRQRERREQMRAYRPYAGPEAGTSVSREPSPPVPPPMPIEPPKPMAPPEAMRAPMPVKGPAVAPEPPSPPMPATGPGTAQRPTFPSRPAYGRETWPERARPYHPGGYGAGYAPPPPAPYQNPWAPMPPPAAGVPQTAPSGE